MAFCIETKLYHSSSFSAKSLISLRLIMQLIFLKSYFSLQAKRFEYHTETGLNVLMLKKKK